jgi:hypothetical protein
MNLFRSEEHVRAWPQFDATSAEGILPVRDWIRYFSQGRMRARLEPDFVPNGASRKPTKDEVLAELGRGGPYWGTGKPLA